MLWEEIKDSILWDDMPLTLTHDILYSDYSEYHLKDRLHNLQYWLEDVVTKYETNKLDSFGKADRRYFWLSI